MCRASCGAGSVEAVQAAVRLHDRLLWPERRMQIRKASRYIGILLKSIRQRQEQTSLFLLFDESIESRVAFLRLHQIAIHVRATVTIELPSLSDLCDLLKIEI